MNRFPNTIDPIMCSENSKPSSKNMSELKGHTRDSQKPDILLLGRVPSERNSLTITFIL